ncbi:hypothetical protein ACCO45_002419 [Purpureocillium lilacinum]|uniref:Uncharacterized protein n=1 Tax=Purpureocillium lilacinum TaxID=33203 RepID=A0ACC4E9U4_PURLI
MQLRLASGNGPITRTIRRTPLRDASPSEIPLIDVSPMFSDSLADRQGVARKVHDAATNNGFFYISNHGIPAEVTDSAHVACLDFFRQDMDVKMKTDANKGSFHNGYRAPDTQRLNPDEGVDIRESYTIRYDPASIRPLQIRQASRSKRPNFQLFTILWQDSNGGLQVLNREGQWIGARPVEGTFVVNIADYLQRITNDRYVSTVHRAQNWSGRERVSMPFFWGFGLHESCGVLDSCVAEGEEKKYGEIRCIDWFNRRIGNMLDLSEEK